MSRSAFALKALLTAALLWLIFTRVPVGKAVAAVRSADLGLFALACAAGFVPVGVGALRIKRLTDRQGMTLTARMHLEIALAASFYGLFLPGFLSGGVLRWHRISRPDGDGAGAAAVVVLNRFIETLASAASGAAFFAIAAPRGATRGAGTALAALLAALVAAAALLANGRASGRLERRLDEPGALPEPVRGALRKLVLAFRQFRGAGRAEWLRIGAFCLLEELSGAVSFYLAALSAGVAAPFADIGWIRSCVNLVTALPVAIGGFGLREGGLMLLLAPFGVAAGVAVAFSFLVFARGLAVAALGGLLEARNAFLRKDGAAP